MDAQIFIVEGTTKTRLDLFEDEGVNINSVIQDVRDIAKVFTEFTKSFTVPASKNNNKIFKHYNNFQILDGFDARVKKDAEIEVNSTLFKKGTIRLDSVEVRNNNVYAYKITFFGNTVNIKDLFGEDKLSDIATSFFSHFDREYTAAEVLTTLQNAQNVTGVDLDGNSVTYNNAFLTPLITHTTRLFYDSGTNYGAYFSDNKVNELGGNLFAHSGVGTDKHHGVYYEELKYAIRLHIIVLAIQSHYGIRFSNDFFNTTNSIYYDLYMWLHRKAGNVFDEEIVTFTIPNWTVTDDDNLECNIKVLSSDTSTIIINDDADGTLRDRVVDVTIQLDVAANSPDFSVLLLEGGEIISRFNVDGSSFAQTVSDTFSFLADNGYFNNEQYQVQIQSRSSVTFNATGTFIKFVISHEQGGVVQEETTQINISSVITSSTTQNFIVQQQMPEMKVIDFITSLFKMFNLTAFEQDDGTIKVQPLDDFYASSGKVWDFTDKVEIDYNVKPALPFKEIDFSYAGLETFLAVDHQKRFALGWGSLDYKANQNESGQRYDFNTEVYKVQPQFEHMKFERMIDNDNNNIKRSQVGWSADEQESAYVGKPLLFYAKRVSGSGSEYDIRFLKEKTHINSNSHTDIGTYIVPSNSQELSPTTSKNNIHFREEVNEYDFQGNTPFSDTLFKRFYRIYIQKVFNRQNRLTSFKCKFPIDFIVNHTLADKISIRGVNYLINSLKIDLKTGMGSMDLLNDVRVTKTVTLSDSSETTASEACSSTENNEVVYYDLIDTIANGTILYTDEQLTTPFAGDGGFYKIVEVNKAAEINSTGTISNLTDC